MRYPVHIVYGYRYKKVLKIFTENLQGTGTVPGYTVLVYV